MSTHVRVEGIRLRFYAAHMATYGGDLEPLHGHNYVVMAECHGPLTADSWVIDFGLVKRVLKDLCDELDHKFLLQRPSALLAVEERVDEYELRALGRRYVFPRSDVAALPIANSTAEEIARYFHGRFCAALAAEGVANLTSVAIGVEEAPGQAGWYTSVFPGNRPGGTVD